MTDRSTPPDGENDGELDAELLGLLGLALEPVAAPADLRRRLLARVGGPDRFLPFLDRLVTLFDLPEADTRRELDAILDPTAEWEEMVPGCTFRDFDGGPAIGDAHAGLIRLQPSTVFPNHRHVGEERVLMLKGRVVDEDGREYRAGDTICMDDGSAHELRAVGDEEAIYAAVVVALEFMGDDAPDD